MPAPLSSGVGYSSQSAGAGPSDVDRRYRWIVMAVVLGGSYLFVLDLTVLGVALPVIARELNAAQSIGIDWVITSYVIAVGTVQPASGWLADRFGRKRVYLAALASFTVGSLLAGLSTSLPMLVGFRVLQGLGGGAMMPVGMAMIYELFPADRRGNALGLWGVAILAAPAVGPPLGGWLTTAYSWRWVFFLNLPIGVAALAAGWWLLRDHGRHPAGRLHWQGWLAAAAGVVAIVVASRRAPAWGVLSLPTIGLFALGTVLLVWMVNRSLNTDHPLIDFRMFTVSTFSVSIAVVSLLQITQFARLTFLPIELQVVRGLSPSEVGLLLAPGALGVATTMWFGGWLADRIGARIPVVTGLSIVTVGTWLLSQISATTPEWQLIAILVFNGVGTGLSLIPNSVAAFNSLPTRFVAQASAVRSVSRQLAVAVGTAAFSAFLVIRLGAVTPQVVGLAEVRSAQQAYNEIFLISAGILVLTLILAFFLPGIRQTREHQAARAEEQRELFEAPV